jgi:hypothetical protein
MEGAKLQRFNCGMNRGIASENDNFNESVFFKDHQLVYAWLKFSGKKIGLFNEETIMIWLSLQEICLFLGTRKALAMAVKNQDISRRQPASKELLMSGAGFL